MRKNIKTIIFDTVFFALYKSPWPIYFETVAEIPIAIHILKLMSVNKTGKAYDIADNSKTPSFPI